MIYWRIVAGFAFSTVGGDLVVRQLVRAMWFYVREHSELKAVNTEQRGSLSMPLGYLERTIYTTSICVGAWQMIGAWLVLKGIAKWEAPSKFRGADNVWLIGTGLSLIFGYVGAWIALGDLPTFW
jgi:hypothetical protein